MKNCSGDAQRADGGVVVGVPDDVWRSAHKVRGYGEDTKQCRKKPNTRHHKSFEHPVLIQKRTSRKLSWKVRKTKIAMLPEVPIPRSDGHGSVSI